MAELGLAFESPFQMPSRLALSLGDSTRFPLSLDALLLSLRDEKARGRCGCGEVDCWSMLRRFQKKVRVYIRTEFETAETAEATIRDREREVDGWMTMWRDRRRGGDDGGREAAHVIRGLVQRCLRSSQQAT